MPEITQTSLFDLPTIPGAMPGARFNGADYSPKHDDARLTGQILRVFDAMSDGHFRTLAEIEQITGDPQASISAQLRHLRKRRWGSHTVEKENRGDRERGLFQYRLIIYVKENI